MRYLTIYLNKILMVFKGVLCVSYIFHIINSYVSELNSKNVKDILVYPVKAQAQHTTLSIQTQMLDSDTGLPQGDLDLLFSCNLPAHFLCSSCILCILKCSIYYTVISLTRLVLTWLLYVHCQDQGLCIQQLLNNFLNR